MPRKKNSQSPKLPELSDLELAIMNIVWDLGECSSAEVIEEVRKDRDLAKTTIRTVLANIRKKGYVEPVPTIERGFRLRPSVPRSRVASRTMHKLVDRLFHGSPGQAIMHLIKNEDVSEEELAEIRKLIKPDRPGDKGV